MTRKPLALATLAAAAICAGGLAEAVPVRDDVINSAVTNVTPKLLARIQQINDAAFLDEPAPTPLGGHLGAVPVDPAVAAELDAQLDTLRMYRANLLTGDDPLTVEAVRVSQTGATQIPQRKAGQDTITATITVQVDRQLRELEPWWVQLLPHELVVDTYTGTIVDLHVLEDLNLKEGY